VSPDAGAGAPESAGPGRAVPAVPAVRPVRPVPVMDRDSRPWWDALARHELVLARCAACRAWRWPPRDMCGRCGSFDWAWEPTSGTGTVASWIVNHHPFSADIPSPYVVVTVRLDEQDDLLLPGSLDRGGTGPARSGEAVDDGLSIGARVLARYLDCDGTDGSTFTLLSWRLAASS
jgi:uncharacterized protein